MRHQLLQPDVSSPILHVRAVFYLCAKCAPTYLFVSQVRGYPRGGLGAAQAAERNQPEAEGLGRVAGMEELRRFRQFSGENECTQQCRTHCKKSEQY